MKHSVRFITPILFAGLVGVPLSSSVHAHAQVIQWNVEPPNYYNDIGRRAFHDGIEAAQRDFQAHRDMDPWHYPQMRNPPVPGEMRERYRDAFLRGYDEGMHRARGWDQDRDNAWRDRDHDHDHDQYPR
jgi:hypothetical protein